MWAQPERFPQTQRQQSQRMVLSIVTQEGTPLAAIHHVLRYFKAHDLHIEIARPRHIRNEDIDRSMLDDLERPRQEDAVHLVLGGQLKKPIAGADRYTAGRQ